MYNFTKGMDDEWITIISILWEISKTASFIRSSQATVMHPGFEEWWLYKWFKFPKLVIFNFYTPIMPRRFLVDTMYALCMYISMCCVNQLVIETKHFHSCRYFSPGQWVGSGGYFIWVVAIFLNVVTTPDYCEHIPEAIMYQVSNNHNQHHMNYHCR